MNHKIKLFFSTIAIAMSSYANAQNALANPFSGSINATTPTVGVGSSRVVNFLIGNNGSNPIPADGAYWLVSFPNIVTVDQSSLNLDGGPFAASWLVNGGGTILALTVVAPGINAKVFNGPKVNYSMSVTVKGAVVGGPLTMTVNDVNEALIAGNNNSGDDNASGPISVFASPLPVKLIDFTATHTDCKAALLWASATEQNVAQYEVEMSNNGVEFTQAGIVKAAGTSTQEKRYSFSYDMKPGTNYFFRLKMVDLDGSFTYSTVQKVSCKTAATVNVKFSPNPVMAAARISGMADGTNTIRVYDIKGVLLQTKNTNSTEATIDLSGYASGIYTLSIDNERTGTVSSRLVKE